MKFYTTKEIKPSGYMIKQLAIQAKGLAGNLDKVWPDVRDSKWTGGSREGWERVPYFLDGFAVLAYLTEDEDMILRTKKFIDAIISRQCADGWICPCTEKERPEYDTWGTQLITKVLTVYYECSGDERIPDVIYRAVKNYYELLKDGKIELRMWAKARWFETFVALNFLWERKPEPWMKELAEILDREGQDYTAIEELWKEPQSKWSLLTHIVNMAMMLKIEAVTDTLLDGKYRGLADRHFELLYSFNGTPVDVFTGDECLSGISPIQGTELCSVVELMYSYEWLYLKSGSSKWADRLETAAFNAFFAAVSDDMWTHQYDQLSNQIACVRFPDKPIFRTNGSDAHLFGLEPHFGCCTSNFGQGLPKLVTSAYVYSQNEIVSVVPLPSVLCEDRATVKLSTDYPFDNAFIYEITAKKDFVFKIRIPEFCDRAEADGKECKGNFAEFELHAGEKRSISIKYFYKPKFVSRPNGLVCVKYGSLVFSVPIEYETKMYEYEKDGVERKFPYCDYELYGKSEWQYAYVGDRLEVQRHGVSDVPFSSKKPPISIKATVAQIQWGYEKGYDNLCAKLPKSVTPCSAPKEISLYPYGCAKLRMTEIPKIKR